MNYCQLALSECDSSLGRVVCSPGLVNNPYSGSDHCVSEPVTYSVGSSKGDAGTLKHVGTVQAWMAHFVTPLKCTYNKYK